MTEEFPVIDAHTVWITNNNIAIVIVGFDIEPCIVPIMVRVDIDCRWHTRTRRVTIRLRHVRIIVVDCVGIYISIVILMLLILAQVNVPTHTSGGEIVSSFVRLCIAVLHPICS